MSQPRPEPEETSTAGDYAYEWRECPDHPWYGVSVIVIDRTHGLCVPPLDGTPRHVVEVGQ